MEPNLPPPSDAGESRESSEETPQHSGAGRVVRGVLKGLGILLAVIVGLVLLLVLALQTRPGAERALAIILNAVNPYENTALSAGEVRGNWVTNLRLYDLRLMREDGTPMATIDTVEASYNLLALFRDRLHLRSGYLAGAYLDIREGPDGVFNFQLPFLPDTLATADTTGGGFELQVDELAVRRTRVDIVFYNPERDSTFRATGIHGELHDLLLTEKVAFNLDSLRFAYELPTGIGEGTFRAGASIKDDVLTVDGLRLASTHSNVTAEGRLRLPDSTDTDVSDIQFTLAAHPLSFADIAPFVSLDPERSVTLDAQVSGSGRRLGVDLDALLSDGATVDLEGGFTPATDGPVEYVLTGRVRGLDPAFFGPPEGEPAGVINVDLSADLRGERLEALTGTASATATDTRIGEYALDRTVLDARFDDGRGQVELTSGLRGAALRIAGTIAPFIDTPRYDFGGQFQHVDLGRFSEGGTQSSNLGGTLRLTGAGFDLQTADAEARLNLSPSHINAYRIEDAAIVANLHGGDLNLSARVLLPEGLVALRGAAAFGETITYRVTEGRVQNLDVAALSGDTTYSSVNGTFSLRGAGTDPNTLRLAADVSLGRTVYGTYVVDDADLDATMRGGRLDARLRADLEGGHVRLAATAQPFLRVPTFQIRDGRFDGVDLGRLTQNPDLSTDLAGTIALTGRGFDPTTMALEGRLDLDASRFNRQQIEAAFLNADLRGGALAFRLGLDVPGGETRLEGEARPFDEVPTYRVARGRFGGVDVGAFSGNPDLTTNLNGSLMLAGEGFDPETMRLTLDLAVGRSRVNNGHIESGTVDARLTDGLARLGADFDLLSGRAGLDAEGRLFDETPTYVASGRFVNVNAAAFAGNDTLRADASLTFDVRGAGLEPETMTLDATLWADSSYFQQVRLDTLDARLHLAGGVLRVDTLELRSNVARATGNGQIALFDTLDAASDFRLDADLIELSPVRPLIGAELLAAERGHLELRAFGRGGQLSVQTNVELRSLVYNDLRMAGLDASAVGEFDAQRNLRIGEANGNLSYFSVPNLNLRDTDFEARYENDELNFFVTLEADERRDARLAGRLDLRPEASQVVIDSLRFRFDQDRWRLLQPATINYGDRYQISGFLLTTGEQQIAVDGVVDPRGDQSLIVTVEGFRIGAIADILGFRGLGGTLDGSVDLTGPAFSPDLNGALGLRVTSYGDYVGDLTLDLRYDSLRLNTDALFTHEDGSTLTIAGHVPMDLRIAPAEPTTPTAAAEGVRVQRAEAPVAGDVAITVEADSFSIGWVRPFLDPDAIKEISGKLDGEINVGGTFEAPTLDGQIALVNGRLGIVETGMTYTDANVHLTLADNEATLERFSVRGGRGTVTGSGTLSLANLALGELDLDLRTRDFLAINNDQFRFVVEGPLQVQGTTDAPSISGDIRVLSGDINLVETAQFQDVSLTQEDIITVESRFGIRVSEADTTVSQVFDAMTLALSVRLERDTWLRSNSNPKMDIQFDGTLDVRKRPGGEINLFGDIQVIPERSRVIQFGRRFDIANGEVQFNGPLSEMQLDVSARYQVRKPRTRETGPTITLGISGRLDDLDLELGSEPQMETADIVSYIATGRPASQSLQFGSEGGDSGGLLGQGAGLALGQLASAIEGVAARDLGLDVIEIEQDGLRGTRLTAGRYFTRRLYASISQPISYGNTAGSDVTVQNNPTIVTLEYEVSSALLARLIRDGSAMRVNLQWDYAY